MKFSNDCSLNRTIGARIQFDEVSRAFPGTGRVVNGVSFTIEPGEFVALLGPSGCGKSTLLRIAAGLDEPDAGEVKVDSFARDFFKGFVFQEAQLLPWRTVLRNVALPLELIGTSPAEARRLAVEALEGVGLKDALERFPSELSGGMKMRASVARAMVTRPSLLFFDEPFAAFDETIRFRLQEDLRRLWELEPMTVVFVTHSVSEAVYLADRSLVFSPRPAQVLLDHRSRLGRSRPARLRADPTYLAEMEIVRAALVGAGLSETEQR